MLSQKKKVRATVVAHITSSEFWAKIPTRAAEIQKVGYKSYVILHNRNNVAIIAVNIIL
jgi:hypothetical protein